jgi:hypothetical protein
MGSGPSYLYASNPAQQQQQQQQQSYQQQFNDAQYAAIPGVRGQQPMPGPHTYTMNGQQMTYDPSRAPQPTGWGRGMAAAGQPMMAALRSGWMNDNLSNEDWQSFLPPNPGMQPGMQPGSAQNHMMQVAPQAAMSGRYGQQAAALAGLLGNPGQGAAPSGGGLLGGRPRGFRVPGGGK